MKILLVESVFHGHRLYYYTQIAKTFLALGAEVQLCSPDPDLMQKAFHESKLAANLKAPWERSSNRLQPWLALKTLIMAEELKPDLVFFCMLDDFFYLNYGSLGSLKAQAHDFIFPYPWAGIYFHPEYTAAKSAEIIFRSKNCRRVFLLDERYVSPINTSAKKAVAQSFPDFYDDTLEPLAPETALLLHGYPRPIVAAMGTMAKRKGFVTLLNMAQIAGAQTPFTAASFGAIPKETYSTAEWLRLQSLITHPVSNVFISPTQISSEGQFNAILHYVDVIYIGYVDFPHSSNLLSKAAWAGKPVLASKSGLIGQEVVKYGLGEVFDEHDPNDGLAALHRLKAHKFDEQKRLVFLEKHSYSLLKQKTATLLQELKS
jgi:glycosyltransferase involved in cell wall biosynthesis